jgi:hypothetical protein
VEIHEFENGEPELAAIIKTSFDMISPDMKILVVQTAPSQITIQDDEGNPIAVLDVGSWPEGLQIDPSGRRLLIEKIASNSLVVYDLVSGRFERTIDLGGFRSAIPINSIRNDLLLSMSLLRRAGWRLQRLV